MYQSYRLYCCRFGVHIKVTNDFAALHVSPQTLAILRQHLNSYGDWSLVGYQQAVECLKSFIVASALLERHVSVEQACQLARLETEYQVSRLVHAMGGASVFLIILLQ